MLPVRGRCSPKHRLRRLPRTVAAAFVRWRRVRRRIGGGHRCYSPGNLFGESSGLAAVSISWSLGPADFCVHCNVFIPRFPKPLFNFNMKIMPFVSKTKIRIGFTMQNIIIFRILQTKISCYEGFIIRAPNRWEKRRLLLLPAFQIFVKCRPAVDRRGLPGGLSCRLLPVRRKRDERRDRTAVFKIRFNEQIESQNLPNRGGNALPKSWAADSEPQL